MGLKVHHECGGKGCWKCDRGFIDKPDETEKKTAGKEGGNEAVIGDKIETD
jgi:hypothetical protein